MNGLLYVMSPLEIECDSEIEFEIDFEIDSEIYSEIECDSGFMYKMGHDDKTIPGWHHVTMEQLMFQDLF